MSGALHGVLASLKSAAAAATDAFFKYVTLLLHGDGTNGAQNNTFLDGSTNAFSITRNGNTTQGSFSPFSQTGWSNYFDGTGDWLSVPDNAAFDLAASDWTVETWVNFSSIPSASGASVFVAQWDGTAISDLGWFFYIFNSAGTYQLYLSYSTTGLNQINLSVNLAAAPTIGAWNHVAFVRSGNNFLVFWNGTQVGATQTLSATIFNSSRVIAIAQLPTGSTYNLTGYLSNLRIVKGTAVYTSNFTPPTAPLTAITNTSLLTCQSNRFIDNSSNAFAITRNGDVSVRAFSPFAPTAAWDASTNGGSGYFDGTGDYLSVADSAAIRFGTGTFTIQGWVYRNAAGATHTIAAKGGASTGWVLQITSTNVLRFTDTTTNIDTTTTIPSSTWTHVAVVRTGTGANGLKLYINAMDSATGTSSTDFNQTDALNIGADRSNANAFNGYIASLKYTAGTAESISVPTAPATGGTVLLNFTNGGIFDNASQTVVETVGNAQISTAQFKWGTGSLAFDGTGDWLLAPDRPEQRFSTGPFTVEMWVYRSASGTYGLVAKGTGTTGWMVSLNSSNQVVFSFASSSFNSTGTVAATTWTHIAVVREGTGTNQTKIYIGGTNDGTGTVNTDFNQTNSLYIGADRTGGSAFNGYIDDLRITTGYARYTANFTPPTAAFPDQ